MKIAVGSTNPAKIEAVKQAFQKVFPKAKIDVQGIEVKSGVSDQPMSDRESIRGATTRAKKAIKALKADFGIGLEGGLQKIGKRWFDSGWIVVIDKKGAIGIGSSIRMHTPQKFMDHIFEGKELGTITDIFFKTKNSKRKAGHFGLMTNNALTRTEGYRDGIISALSRFIHPHLFEE